MKKKIDVQGKSLKKLKRKVKRKKPVYAKTDEVILTKSDLKTIGVATIVGCISAVATEILILLAKSRIVVKEAVKYAIKIILSR